MNKVWKIASFFLVSYPDTLKDLFCSQIFMSLALLCCLLAIVASAKKMKHSKWTDEEAKVNDMRDLMGQDVDTFDGDKDGTLFSKNGDEMLFSDPGAYRPFCKTGCRTFLGFPLVRLACMLACELL